MTIKCTKCGKEISFEPEHDAVDEDGEVYRCRQCGWPFWWPMDRTNVDHFGYFNNSEKR